jgi:hypothetical protein
MRNVIESRPVLIDGEAFMVSVVADENTVTSDYDCFTEEDIKAHYLGDWGFVGVVLTDTAGREESVWAVAYGNSPGWQAPLTFEDLLTDDNYVPALHAELKGA